MKVRCKHTAMEWTKGIHTDMEWTVVEESPSFYIAKINSALGYACLDKAHYEPMQEWVDVTKECALLEDGYGRYSLFHNGYAVEASNKRYKVTSKGCVVYKAEAQK